MQVTCKTPRLHAASQATPASVQHAVRLRRRGGMVCAGPAANAAPTQQEQQSPPLAFKAHIDFKVSATHTLLAYASLPLLHSLGASQAV
jgi:hypothetical protein